jgi:hypothetical protein
LIAQTTVHFRTLSTLKDLRKDLRIKTYTLENRIETDHNQAGYLNVEDPDKVYVRRLGASGGAVWQYRVYLPANRKYELRAGHAQGRVINSPLPNGGDPEGFIVTVAFRRRAGESCYVVAVPGFAIGGVVECRGAWENERYDHSEQRELHPTTDCVLLKYGTAGLFSHIIGQFRIWISPKANVIQRGE